MADEFKFYSGNMEDFTRGLTESAVRLQAETDKTVAETGAMIAAAAKAIVKPHSKSIAVSMEMVPGAAVIHGKSPGSPLAVLYEKGNKKGTSKSGRSRFDSNRRAHVAGNKGVLVFAHPVFGNKNVWIEQARFLFLSPARTMVRKEAKRMMDAAWRKALEPLRLK